MGSLRRVAIVTGFLTVGLLVLAVCAEEPPAFALSDLPLLCTLARPGWSAKWSGAVEVATIAAYLQAHGYSGLLGDLNQDGAVNGADAILLADFLGKGALAAEAGTTDVLLTAGAAGYIGSFYPGKFEAHVYDLGFSMEYQAQSGMTFASDSIPGIISSVVSEPTLAAYKLELARGVVILGIPDSSGAPYYLAGRSFFDAKSADGYDVIDVAWGEDDPAQPGIQGQVLRVSVVESSGMYLFFQGGWVPVEFLLALVPLTALTPPTPATSGTVSPSTGCPDLSAKITNAQCDVLDKPGMFEKTMSITAEVEVKNIGTATASNFSVSLACTYGTAEEQVFSLAAGEVVLLTLSTSGECDVNCHGRSIRLTATADSRHRISECGNEANNADDSFLVCP